MRRALSLMTGIAVASVIGLTTDQIIQNVYDSSNQALRLNVVASSGSSDPTPTPQPTATPLVYGANGTVVIFAATELGSYTGSSCGAGFGTGLSAAGAWTCATPVPPTPLSTATPQPTPTPVSPSYRSAVYTSSANGFLATTGNNFLALGSSTTVSTTETSRSSAAPIAVTVKNLSCYFNSAPASGKNWTITLRTGTCGSSLSDSALTCTVTGDGTLQTCTDSNGAHAVAIRAASCASLNIVGSGTPGASVVYCSVEGDY